MFSDYKIPFVGTERCDPVVCSRSADLADVLQVSGLGLLEAHDHVGLRCNVPMDFSGAPGDPDGIDAVVPPVLDKPKRLGIGGCRPDPFGRFFEAYPTGAQVLEHAEFLGDLQIIKAFVSVRYAEPAFAARIDVLRQRFGVTDHAALILTDGIVNDDPRLPQQQRSRQMGFPAALPPEYHHDCVPHAFPLPSCVPACFGLRSRAPRAKRFPGSGPG